MSSEVKKFSTLISFRLGGGDRAVELVRVILIVYAASKSL